MPSSKGHLKNIIRKEKKTIISANNNFPFSMSNTPAAISRAIILCLIKIKEKDGKKMSKRW